MKRLLISLCFLLSFLYGINIVNAYSTASTGVYALYLRTLPDKNSVSLTLIPTATKVTLIEDTLKTGNGCDDNWFKVEYNSYSGYVCSTYLININWENEDAETDEDVAGDTTDETPDETIDIEEMYKQELEKFPESYKVLIEELHKIYPNAVFKVQNVDISFNDFASYQYQGYEQGSLNGCLYGKGKGMSLLEDTNSSRDGLKSLDSWAYTALTDTFNTSYYGGEAGRWYAPSLNTVNYYLDPRNFISTKSIFMFEQLSYTGDYYLEANIEKMLIGTFMYKTNVTGKENTTFARAFIEAGKENNVNPYFLVSRVLQEIGGTRSAMVSGTWSLYDNAYYGYYNFYNIEAAGNSVNETIKNGLMHAKSQGWDNEYDAIVGGAYFINIRYISQGQGTAYFQKFDVYGPCYGFNQYMQNIEAPLNEAYKTYNGYKVAGLLDSNFVFIIPVYNEMPEKTKLDDSRNSNNYLKDLTINGTTVEGFDYLTEEYTINVSPLIQTIEIAATKSSSKSKVEGTGTFEIKEAEQTKEIIVTAQNGTTKTYKITVTRDETIAISISEILNTMLINSDGTYISSIDLNTKASDFIAKAQEIDSKVNITIKNSKDEEKTDKILATGDKVNIISGEENKTFTVVIYGDNNGDGKIDALDYVRIKNYIMNNGGLTDAFKMASDVNRDTKIDALDYVNVKNYIMGNYHITQ